MQIKKILNAIKSLFAQFFDKTKPILMSIVLGLLIGFLIMVIFKPNQSLEGIYLLAIGGFKDGLPGFVIVLHKSAPIILTGLAVSFAFRTGLFNIGASGQFMIGAISAILFAHLVEIPAPLRWIFAMVVGMLAGGLWGVVPGLLKATRNVNEVVSSIMMNYIAAFSVSLIIVKSSINNEQTTSTFPMVREGQLPTLFNSSILQSVDISFIVAVIIAILVHIILHKTTLGFELKASGFSIDASKYAGMNTKRNVILAMAISGVISGLGGALFYLNASREMSSATLVAQQGFIGISVALLGLGEPLGVIFSGVFLTHLLEGGFNLQSLVYATELSEIIISVIIYFVSISLGLQLYLRQLRKKRALKKEKEGDSL